MKKILAGLVLTCLTPIAFATSAEKDYGKLCEELGGKYAVLESFPTVETCSINEHSMSLASFQDKYNQFVLGMMIHYVSEYKYSDKTKWNSYLEFLSQDIEDMKTFQQAKITPQQKEKLEEYTKVQESIYTALYLQEVLGEKVRLQIESILEKYEAKLPESKQQAFYKKAAQKLDAKIKEMEYFQMVAHFTPEGYQAFLFKMNVYKYMLLLINGRIQ